MNRMRVLIAILVISLARVALAEPRPSFSLEHFAWEATDVVVAGEGKEIDGDVVILESWKGTLAEGDRIVIPELAVFAPDAQRTVAKSFQPDPTRTERVTGNRMVLFLIAREGGETPRWMPVDATPGQTTVAAAWVESGSVFGFQQTFNPGPSELVALGLSDREMKEAVGTIDSQQHALARALESREPELVSAAMQTLVVSASPYVRLRIISVLGDHGVAGAAAARDILRNPSLLEDHDTAVEALAAAGGADAVPPLVELLREELGFWKKAAPDLRVGWWNDLEMEQGRLSSLRAHYGRAYAALHALRANRSPEVATVVGAFRDLWISAPQLGSGNHQIVRACDLVLGR